MAKLIECDRCSETAPQPKGVQPQHEQYAEMDVWYYETTRVAINRKHLCPRCLSSLEKWLGSPDPQASP